MTHYSRFIQEIKYNHLFAKWPMKSYKNYMNSLIITTHNLGPEHVYNCFKNSKLPFVVFRTIDNFYYVDTNSKDIIINKFDKKLKQIDSFNLGYRSVLQVLLENIVRNV